MSAYGPGKDAPIQLFGGELIEQSPEEIRTLYYRAIATNNVAQYVSKNFCCTTTLLMLNTSSFLK